MIKITSISILLAIAENSFARSIVEHITEQISDSNVLKWAAIIIPSLVTIAGLLITNRNTKRGFEEALKQKNNDQKRDVYTAAFIDIDDLVTRNFTIFDTDHFEKIVSHKAKLKLCGSKSVIKCYEDIFNLCLDTISPFWQWVAENHPNNQQVPEEQYYYGYNEEEVYRLFEEKCEQYKKTHLPKNTVLSEKVNALLNEMRDDLGNDKITIGSNK